MSSGNRLALNVPARRRDPKLRPTTQLKESERPDLMFQIRLRNLAELRKHGISRRSAIPSRVRTETSPVRNIYLRAWGLERQGDLGQPEVVGQRSSGEFCESTQPVVDGVAVTVQFSGGSGYGLAEA